MIPTNAQNARPQAGFTLPEILAVIALVGILISMVATNFGNAARDLSLTSSKDTLINDIPAAMISYRAINGNLTGLSKTDITNAGVPSDSPDGDSWTLNSASNRTATVEWALTNAENPDDFGDDLKSSLDAAKSTVTSAAYDGDEKKLTVTYQIP